MTLYRVQTTSGWSHDADTPEALAVAVHRSPDREVSTVAVDDDGAERDLTDQEQERFDDAFDERIRADLDDEAT